MEYVLLAILLLSAVFIIVAVIFQKSADEGLSGTEPKIKFYILAVGKDEADSKGNAAACKASLEKMLGLNPGELRK